MRAPVAEAGRTCARLHAPVTVPPAPGNELVAAHVMGTSVQPGRRVTLTTCWNIGLPLLYIRYQVMALPPAMAAGTIQHDAALYVPTEVFTAWTVRMIAVETATGHRLATLTRVGHPLVPAHAIHMRPRSRPVAPDHGYPSRLYTHREGGFAVDFDGAFWDLADPIWAGSFGNPPRPGTTPFRRER